VNGEYIFHLILLLGGIGIILIGGEEITHGLGLFAAGLICVGIAVFGGDR